ncbi:MAG: ABC transporter ATP-binding protein/permease [Clostridiales bacterium]|nr:ABC transporter ATP-binding protein/permease [Clostridiales bacterium]
MIQIKNIVKNYLSGDNEVHALRDVSINFRNSEFVSILGPSGCGKTTMLNIIGGLDKYTSGDLIINEVSTKDFKDKDWDAYRNHSVGFVFQSYNLIPHQTVLQNVEIALTISGVSKSERKARAIHALEEVGLGDQIHKKPNALSGGQMQRVAIARALVNNPEIILADEPTGALDTETSVQVMEILKKVAQDRLVVMVTHNPDLAKKYSTRIINMLDGKILSDTKPYTDLGFTRSQKKELDKEYEKEVLDELAGGKKKRKEKKPSMSFWTAFKLSLKNLFTKKGRTALTSFAGSIGIIGIALILAVSQGMTTYINHVQESTLASYPIVLEEKTIDMTALLTSFMNVGKGELTHDRDGVYKDPVIAEMVNALSSVESNVNDLKSFKLYLEDEMNKEGSDLQKAVTGVQYTYNLELDIYTKNVDNAIVKSDTGKLMSEMIGDYMMAKMSSGSGSSSSSSDSGLSSDSMSGMSSSMMSIDLWQEMLPGMGNDVINSLVYEQYEMIDGGSWPNEYDEIVLVVNENNEVDDLTLYALGLIGESEIDAIIDAAAKGEQLDNDNKKWTYEEIKARTFKTILPADSYVYSETTGTYVDVSALAESDPLWLSTIYEEAALELKITGVIRPKKDADASLLNTGLGYTSLLTQYIINKSTQSAVVTAQKASPTIDLLTGKPFAANTGLLSNEEKISAFTTYVGQLSEKKKADTYIAIKCLLSDTELMQKTTAYMTQYCPNRAAQEALIITSVSSQMGVEPEALAGYFADMTDEQIQGVAYALCQSIVQVSHETMIRQQYATTPNAELATNLTTLLSGATDADIVVYYDKVTEFSENTYEEVLVKLGCIDLDSPHAINLYVSSFEDKDVIKSVIDSYNANVDEEKKITYVDYLGLMMSSITTIIDAITYVLIAFVSISLIVSSIMIGVITLISVQERTKEIGILRAIGASKRDVSSMFNAETMIIGFTSGLLGVLVTYLLCIPINLILKALTGLANLKAILPIPAAIILVLISMGLTLISGLIPSRSAAKKDPVIALRTE